MVTAFSARPLDAAPTGVLFSLAVRRICTRCLRPEAFCVCAGLAPAPSRTRVVILQHPREARLAICSARLTRVALANAELHRTVDLDGHPRVRELLAGAGTALLFPGDGATPVEELAGRPPAALLVLDGTWIQAGKMLEANPRVAALPRLSLAPSRPSGYRELRREPAPGHLSTLEAVALALGALERDPARFAPMMDAFHRAVSLQLECSQGARRSPRHRAARRQRAPSPRPSPPLRGGEGGVHRGPESDIPSISTCPSERKT